MMFFDLHAERKFQTIASEMLAKLQLERIFMPELRRVFGVIVADFQVSALTGNTLNKPKQEAAFGTLLDHHYKRVQKRFKGAVLDQKARMLGIEIKQGSEDESKIDDILALALLTWREQISTRRAKEIVGANEAMMRRAIDDARANIAARGDVPTNATVAREAAALLRIRFQGRVTRIALTETQESAEASKQLEAETRSGLTPFALIASGGAPLLPKPEHLEKIQKTWQTMGDDRVRPAHVNVNGTTLSVNGIFFVGDSRMRFPADAYLGASVGQTINCRCSAVYTFTGN